MTSSNMAEDDFDWDAEDFDPDAGFQKKDDRWEGEDEGLNLEAMKEDPKPKEPEVKSKKPKKDKIAEKKAQRRAEELEKAAQAQEQPKPLSAEEQLAEKLRLQKIQEESDLAITKQLFGVASEGAQGSIDSMHPSTPEEFEQFEEALTKKLFQLESSPHFIGFMEKLLRNVGTNLDVEDLRKLSNTLSTLATEKQKAAKPSKHKKKGKAALGVGKASKKMDAFGGYGGDDDLGGEFDDFM